MACRPSERRWAVISSAEDCRHIWLGRNSDPTPDELDAIVRQLSASGVTAWLAITEGVYYSSEPMNVMMVRPLAGDGDWPAACEAFLEKRRATVARAE